MTNAISLTDVVKTFGETRAVNGLTLDVPSGICMGLLGPNGAGKSTTMRIMVGLTPATSGTAELSGRRFADLPVKVLSLAPLLGAAIKNIHTNQSVSSLFVE